MLKEAEMSINLSKKVISKVEEKLLSDEFIEKDLDVSFEIHCDLGRHGKSRDSIKKRRVSSSPFCYSIGTFLYNYSWIILVHIS